MISFAELSSMYSNNKKPPSPLSDSAVLPGATVYDKLSKLHFSRKSSKLFAEGTSLANLVPAPEQDVIAVCLVIVDKLPHEEIWKEWLEEGGKEDLASSSSTSSAVVPTKAKIVVHAKHPGRITSPWVKERLLPLSYNPEWNSPEIIRAMLATMNEGLRDPRCGRFIFGTESCVPLYRLSEISKALFKQDASWLNAFCKGKNNWESQACFRAVNEKVIPPKNVWKTIPGWIMLNRRHAAEISILASKSCSHAPCNNKPDRSGCLGVSEDADLVRAWGEGGTWREDNGNVWAPEEVFFPTMLSILGYLNESGKDEVVRKSVTYARWKKLGDANPISFSVLDAELLKEFRKEGSLFGRKFGPDAINVKRWRLLMDKNQPTVMNPKEMHAPGVGKRKRENEGEGADSEKKVPKAESSSKHN
jgi:hypothetical protein